MTLPNDGATIVFHRLPIGSYATIGVPYRANVRGKGRKAYVYLTNALTGAGTFDRGFCYGQAAFYEMEV